MNSLAKSRIFGFIAMGLALVAIVMLFLPYMSIKGPASLFDDGSVTVNLSLTTFFKFNSALSNDEAYDSLQDGLEDFLDGFSSEVENAKAAFSFVIAFALCAIILAFAAMILDIFNNKVTRIIALVTTFISFAFTATLFIIFVAAASKAKEGLGILGAAVKIGPGIGIILAFAFLLVSFVFALIALIFAVKKGEGAQQAAYEGVNFNASNGFGTSVQPQSFGTPVPQAAVNASITFLSGSCAGYQIPVEGNDEIVIGKDPSLCAIVIDKKYEKVSRKHCGVRFDASRNMYIVTDYSTNGTRVVGGQKLAPHSMAYIERGTTINLANTENSFKLN